jgi:hypothetical protein
MEIVVVDVESLRCIDAPTAPKGGVQEFSVLWRLGRVGKERKHLGIFTGSLEEAANRDEIQDLADIPSGEEVAAEFERLLIVEKIVLLEHTQHTAFCDHRHRLVQKEIGELLVRDGAVFSLILFVAAL